MRGAGRDSSAGVGGTVGVRNWEGVEVLGELIDDCRQVDDDEVGTGRLAVRPGLDGPVVSASPSDSGEEALGSGTVLLVDGCLYLGDSSGTSVPVALVWQVGTRWDPVKSEVLLPDGTRVPIGTSISAGGGYQRARRNRRTPDGRQLPMRSQVASTITFSSAGVTIAVITSPSQVYGPVPEIGSVPTVWVPPIGRSWS